MRAGVGQGITNAFNNYEQGQEQADASQMRKLQMEQLKKAIANQDAAALKQLKIDNDAQKMSEIQFDTDGNIIQPPNLSKPNSAAPSPQMQPPQNQPMPQPPNPGQASVPNPVNKSVMNQGQVFQRPPQMPSQAPPQVPQGGPRPPQPPQPMGMINQVAPQSVMQTPQMQMQAPQQPRPVIPPYQSAANLQPKPPVQQPQMSNAAPPDPAKLQQIEQVKGLVQEAKSDMMTPEELKKYFSPIVSPTEKKLMAIQAKYPGMAPEAYIKVLGFDNPKDMRSQIDKEDDLIEKQRRLALDYYDKKEVHKETHEKNLAEEKNWESEERHRTNMENIMRQRINASGIDLGGGITEGRAAAYMAGQTLGQGKNQKPMAIAEIHKLYPDLSYQEIAQKGEQATELNKERTQQLVMKGKISGFEKTAIGNIDEIQKELDKQIALGERSDLPTVNALLDKWKTATGQVYNQGINLFGQESASELAKLASSATGAGAGGTLHDREEWKSFIGKDGSYAQMKKSLDSARTAINIRVNANDAAIHDTTQQLNDLWPNKDKSTNIEPQTKAPPAAEAYLKAHPEQKAAFKEKYGYLPKD